MQVTAVMMTLANDIHHRLTDTLEGSADCATIAKVRCPLLVMC